MVTRLSSSKYQQIQETSVSWSVLKRGERTPVKSDSRGHSYSGLFEVLNEGHLIPTSKESGVFETLTRQAIVGVVDVCVFVFLRHLSRASREPFKRLQQRTSVCERA